jgi:hypothetical protein
MGIHPQNGLAANYDDVIHSNNRSRSTNHGFEFLAGHFVLGLRSPGPSLISKRS